MNFLNNINSSADLINRRCLLGQSGIALGSLAASSMLRADNTSSTNNGIPGLPHFEAKAKRVIYMFQSGGPSHIDLFDHSDKINKLHGTELPDSVRGGQRLTGMTAGLKKLLVCAPVSPMKKRGNSGTWMSEMVPYTGDIADKITVINSMHTDAINHDPGITLINTGSQIPGRPSLGSWASYGLGSTNSNMPAYIVLISQGNGKNPGQPIFSRLWGSGFLPSQHQGVLMRSGKNPLLYLNDPPGIERSTRRRMLDDLAQLNKENYQKFEDPEIETRIAQYEMAFRMQTSVPELADLSGETQHVLDLYGPEVLVPGTFANSCIMARRMAERGVRFTQIFHRGWDQHGALPKDLPKQCNDVDQPSAGLLTDLKHRGMLDDTLVVWGGEFGRTPMVESNPTLNRSKGRDHHPQAFSLWLAGGGVKGGMTLGATDELGFHITDRPVHIHDLQATLLHLMGLDHERLTFHHAGRDYRLTDVHGKLVKEIVA